MHPFICDTCTRKWEYQEWTLCGTTSSMHALPYMNTWYYPLVKPKTWKYITKVLQFSVLFHQQYCMEIVQNYLFQREIHWYMQGNNFDHCITITPRLHWYFVVIDGKKWPLHDYNDYKRLSNFWYSFIVCNRCNGVMVNYCPQWPRNILVMVM